MDQRTGLSTGDANRVLGDMFVNDQDRPQMPIDEGAAGSGTDEFIRKKPIQCWSIGRMAGPGTAEFIMPTPLKLKGKFSYFGIKWDDHDVANARENNVVRIDTDRGPHKLEIRQVNTSLWSLGPIQRFTFNVSIDAHSRFQVESDGSSFNLRVL